MNKDIYTPKQDYKVLVRCFTYNQSKYIEDALNGFAMQQTKFPFVCLVMDDCSTDGEQDVIKTWMERECDMEKADYIEIELSNIILVPHKSNTKCTFAFYFLKLNLYKEKVRKMSLVSPWREHCEYEAMCEGDDYWITDDKLQSQTSLMDSNEDYSMCFHAVRYLSPDGETNDVHRYHHNVESCLFNDMILIGGSYAKLNAMMINIKKYGNGFLEWAPNSPVGDCPMQLTLFIKGKVAYLDTIMSVYRVDAINSWTQNKRYDFKAIRKHYKEVIEMWKAFDKYTSFEYHRLIRKRININRKNHYCLIIGNICTQIKEILGL